MPRLVETTALFPEGEAYVKPRRVVETMREITDRARIRAAVRLFVSEGMVRKPAPPARKTPPAPRSAKPAPPGNVQSRPAPHVHIADYSRHGSLAEAMRQRPEGVPGAVYACNPRALEIPPEWLF